MIEWTYFEAASLEHVRAFLAEHPDAKIVAGGTDLVVAARSGKSRLPAHLVAIHRVTELKALETTADGGLRIGALVSHSDLESSRAVTRSWSALSDAAALVGSPATRHVGTVGGNVCNASPAMELGSPLLIFDANVELTSASEIRRIPFSEFAVGPGRTAAEPNELLTAIVLPPQAVPGRAASAYGRLEYRLAMEIAIVGAGAMIRLDEAGRCIDARVALTAVSPTCVRALETEAMLRGQTIDSGLLDRAAHAAAASAKPIDDVRASADYRRAMVPVIVRRALARALDRATASSPR